MKKIILLCSLFTASSIIKSMQLSKPIRGIVKPKTKTEDRARLEKIRSQRTINHLNAALHYSRCAKEDLQNAVYTDSLLNPRFNNQASSIDQLNNKARHLLCSINLQEYSLECSRRLLIQHLTAMEQRLIDTTCDIALFSQEEKMYPILAIPVEILTDETTNKVQLSQKNPLD